MLSIASMASVVIVRKAYGELTGVDYPILAAKANSRTRLHLRPNQGTATVPQSIFHSRILRTIPVKNLRVAILGILVLAMMTAAAAQQAPSNHVLSSDEVRKVVPRQKAPVELRNAVGFQLSNTKMVLAALVDASGYSTAIQQKYQGLLITDQHSDSSNDAK